MTHVLAAQARIAATTKIAVPGVLAMAGFVILTSLAPAVLFGHHQDPHTVLEGGATVAAVTAMLLGALQTAGDLQNGMTRALLLVEPRRLRVLGAQLLVSVGLGAGVGAAAALLADTTLAVLGRLGLPAASLGTVGLGTTVAAALCGLLGAAAGIPLHPAAAGRRPHPGRLRGHSGTGRGPDPGMTGSSDGPRRTRPSPWPQCSSAGGTARRSWGKRLSSDPSASWPSMRASVAPRQWRMPCPNARWRTPARSMSSVSASG
jgi:hypothetical protein